jgi:1,4-alpha-glucan branching enzyme
MTNQPITSPPPVDDPKTAAINALMGGYHGAPFDVLGPHREGDTLYIRALQPSAQSINVVDAKGKSHPMKRIHDGGFWEATINKAEEKFIYHFEAVNREGQPYRYDDPYRFSPQMTDFDRHLLSEGNLLYSYNVLGAHLTEIEGVQGVRFTVWAPNAERVSIVGNFNGWDSRMHPMRFLDGWWELFIPGLVAGDAYKYDVSSRFNMYRIQKCDPYGFASELRPNNASVIADLSTYTWGDGDWVAKRDASTPLETPMVIYEVHLGSWRRKPDGRWLTYRELAETLIPYMKEMHYTHIELMPVSEHPFDASWGYQVTGYYAPTSRFGTPEDFMYFVDQCHQNNIGVLLDWVPAHFPKDGHGLGYFDGTHLYEHADARRGEHPDWGTLIFNYGRNEVRNFLVSNALFWIDKYHIDGLRVDAVSSMLYLDFSRKAGEWVPNEQGGNENFDAIRFLRSFNEIVHDKYPGIVTVAEESTSWAMVSRPTSQGGLGFTMKWNMGWMHDTLKYISKDPVYRRWEHNVLTFSMLYAFSENFILSLSHDEVVHMKGSLIYKIAGDWWQKFATLRTLFGYQYTHPGKKLNFMGQEFGQWSEWSEARALDWYLLDLPTHQGLKRWVQDLNAFYQSSKPLWEVDFDWQGFKWINANDNDQSIYSYVRFGKNSHDFLVVLINFTPVPREGYTIGVPEACQYAEVLNSDSAYYGGSNVGNSGLVQGYSEPWGEYPARVAVTVPPLGMVVLRPKRYPPAD